MPTPAFARGRFCVGMTVRVIDHDSKLLAVGISGLYNAIGVTCALKRWTSASTTIKFARLLRGRTIEGLAKVTSWVINLCEEAESLIWTAPCGSRHQPEKEPVMAKMTLGTRLWEARLRKGFSRQSLADHLTVSAASIYLWETDRSVPRDGNLSAICKALGLPIRATKALAAA
jgi:DNA-binding XRE family transcriptional regulator